MTDRMVVHPADLASIMDRPDFVIVHKYADGEPGEVGRVLGADDTFKRVFVSPEAPKWSDLREAALDKVQTIIEDAIKADEMAHRGIDDLDFPEFVQDLGAAITNHLDEGGWLNVDPL